MSETKNDTAARPAASPDDPASPVQRGTLGEFEQLVRKHQPYAYALAIKFLCDRQEAEDVVQETFVRVWNNIDRYDPGRKFTTWLYAIVSNLCVDRFRSLSRQRGLFSRPVDEHLAEHLPDERDWEAMHSDEQLAAIIRTLAGGLSETQRLVFTLRDLHGLTVEEVVETTGLSTGSVKTNLHYARRSIRELLARRYGMRKENQ